MAILTTIAGIPLFSTVEEALNWASENGLTGFHTHSHQGVQGYMGGANHLEATGMPLNTNAPLPPQTTPTTNTNTSGGVSSY